MAKQHPFGKKPEFGKKLALSAVRDQSTDRGSSKENDEMRRIEIHANALADRVANLENPQTPVAPAAPTTTTPTVTPDKPKGPAVKSLQTLHNGITVVDPTNQLNFVDGEIKFTVTKTGDRANVYAKRPLTVQDDGVSIKSRNPNLTDTVAYIDFRATSGIHGIDFRVQYESEDRVMVQASGLNRLYTGYKFINGGTDEPQFAGDLGYVVDDDNSMLYFIGDSYNFEGDWPSVSGTHANLPTAWVTPILKKMNPYWLNTSEYPYRDDNQTTMIRYRVTPILKLFDPNETDYSSDHTTRIFFKASGGVTPHVDVEDPAADILYPGGIDPRSHAAKVWFDIDDNLYDIQNLGASGTNIGEVYASRSGKTFYLRRIKTDGSLTLTEDTDYITISGTDHTYSGSNYGTGVGVFKDITGSAPEVLNFWKLIAGTNILVTLTPSGIRIDGPSISGTGADYDIDNVGIGEGHVYRDKDLGSPILFHLRGIKSGPGTYVTEDDNDITVSASGYAAVASGYCISVSTPYNFYWKTVTSGTDQVFAFRNFGVSGDIELLACSGGAYMLSSDLTGISLGSGVDIYHGKDSGAHQLQFNSIRGAGSITVDLDPDNETIYVSGTNSTYTAANVGSGLQWYRDATAGNPATFNFRTVSGVGSVSTYYSGDMIMISGLLYSGTNLGTGHGLYVNTVSGVHQFKSIIAGSGIGITEDSTSITITASGTVYSMDNVGVGEGDVYRDITSNTFHLRRLKQAGSVTIITETDRVVVSGTDHTYTVANVGGATEAYRDTTPGDPSIFNLRTFSGIGSVTVYSSGDIVYVSGTDNDHKYTVANVGGASEVYRDTTAGDPSIFNLRTISGIGSVTVFVAGDVVYVSGLDNDHLYEIDNVGTGQGHVWRNTTSGVTSTFHLKTILAGSGIIVEDLADEIKISASGMHRYEAVASGFCVAASTPYNFYWKTVSGTDVDTFAFRNFQVANDLHLTVCSGGAYVLDVNIQAANIGSGLQWYINKTDSTLNFRTIIAGSGILVDYSESLEEIVITNLWAPVYYDMDNVGGATEVYRNTTGSGTISNPYVFNMRTISGVGSVTTYLDGDVVVVSGTTIPYVFRNVGADTGEVWKSTRLAGSGAINTTSSITTGTGVLTDGTYQLETTGGTGSGCTVIVIVSGGALISFSIADPGEGYVVGDTITLDHFGDNNYTFDVVSVINDRNIVSLRTLSVADDLYMYQDVDHIIFRVQVQGQNLDTEQVYSHRSTDGLGHTTLHFRGLKGAGSVSVTQSTNYLTISGSDTDHTYSMDNVGSGTGNVWKNTTTSGLASTFHLKTMYAGSGMVITDQTNEVRFDVLPDQMVASGSCIALGSPYNFYWQTISGTTNTFVMRNFAVSNDLGLMVCSGGAYVFNVDIQANNVGSGVEVYKDKTPYDGTNSILNFRSIRADGTISIDIDPDNETIVISGSSSSVYYTHTWDGTGYQLNNGTTGTGSFADPYVFHFKTLKYGTGVVISNLGDELLISGMSHHTISNDGGGEELYINKTGTGAESNPYVFHLRTISGSGDITADTIGDVVVISGTKNWYSVRHVGPTPDTYPKYALITDTGGDGSFYNPFYYTLPFMIPGSGIAMDDSTYTNGLVITAINWARVQNEGSGEGIYSHVSGTGTWDSPFTYHLRSIVAGPGIYTASGTDTITISASGVSASGIDGVYVYSGSPFLISGMKVEGANVGGQTGEIYEGRDYIDGQVLTFGSLVAGTGYGAAGIYYNRSTTGGHGTGATLDINVDVSGHLSSGGGYPKIRSRGRGYQVGDVLSINGGTGTVTVTAITNATTTLNFRTVAVGTGLSIVTDTDRRRVTIASVQTVTASGVTMTGLGGLDFEDTPYGIAWEHDPGLLIPDTSILVPHFINYNTSWDTPFWVYSGTNHAYMTLATNTWQPVYFDSETIEDQPNWVAQDLSDNTYPWRFKPDNELAQTWDVKVAVSIYCRDAISNTVSAVLRDAELALFINDVYYRTLDLNTANGPGGDVRDALIAANSNTPIPGWVTPTSNFGHVYLEGKALVRLANNSDKLTVKFRHQSGSDRYVVLNYGFIDIHKTGENGMLLNPVQTFDPTEE